MVVYQGVPRAKSWPTILVVGKGPVRHLIHDRGPYFDSPGPMIWGIDSAATRHTAHAILSDFLGYKPDDYWVTAFASEVLAELPPEGWELTGEEIDQWNIMHQFLNDFPACRLNESGEVC